MKTKLAVLAIAMAATLPAYAGSRDIEDLAAYTGISERKVMMTLGTRSSYAEYPYTYQRYKARFVRALGRQNYEQLMAGKVAEAAATIPRPRGPATPAPDMYPS